MTKTITVPDDFTQATTTVMTVTENFTVTMAIPNPPVPVETCPVYGTWFYVTSGSTSYTN